MWPFSEPSLAAAIRISDMANLALLGSLVVGVLSTYVIVQMANVKESHWDKERAASRERVSKLDNETVRLSAETESARAAIADANARTAEAGQRAAQADQKAAEAELTLEQLRRQVGPRQINRNIFLNALKDQPKAPTEVLFLKDDPDSFFLAQQIWQMLRDAEWDVTPPAPVQPSDLYPTSPTVMSAGGQPSGVTIVAHFVSVEEGEAMSKIFTKQADWIKTPWTVLSNAFLESMGSVKGSGGGPSAPPEGHLRVVVAPRG